MLFIECSAKTGHNVDNMFVELSDEIIKRIEKNLVDPTNESIGIKIGLL